MTDLRPCPAPKYTEDGDVLRDDRGRVVLCGGEALRADEDTSWVECSVCATCGPVNDPTGSLWNAMLRQEDIDKARAEARWEALEEACASVCQGCKVFETRAEKSEKNSQWYHGSWWCLASAIRDLQEPSQPPREAE